MPLAVPKMTSAPTWNVARLQACICSPLHDGPKPHNMGIFSRNTWLKQQPRQQRQRQQQQQQPPPPKK